jgi:anti-anti-sigma factor
VDIEGQLIVSNRQELKQRVLDEAEAGARKVLVDFARTGYIDSAGLGVLVSLAKRLRELGGDIRLANLNDDLQTLFELTKLDTLFQISDSRERALDLRIPSDVQQIEAVVASVVRCCAEHALDGRQLRLNLPVALTEALSNAILRGNREDRGKEVRVRLEITDRELIVEVEDEGQGFDLEACTEDPTTPDQLEREDGRGLFLMQQLMDRVERFRSLNGRRGNVVRLILHRPRGHAA